jgi:hypothetical protein
MTSIVEESRPSSRLNSGAGKDDDEDDEDDDNDEDAVDSIC